MSILIRGGLVLTDVAAQPRRADILVDGDSIAQVGAQLDAGPGVTVIDAPDRLVIPGLINAHTHAHNHLVKGAIDKLPLEIWAQYLAARVANRTPREVYVGTAIGAIEMAKTGTTCACEMAMVLPWPTDDTLDAVAQAYVDVGLRASIAPQVLDLSLFETEPEIAQATPQELRDEVARRPRQRPDELVATLRRAIDRWHGAADGRINFGLGPTIATRCSDGLLVAFRDLLQEHRTIPLQTHLDETKVGAHAAKTLHGMTVTARLHKLGLLGPRTLLAHSIWLEDGDIDLIAASGSTVAYNPISNLKLGAGIAPIPALLERGCNVAVGTDGSASSDNQNMFGAIRLAAILHRVVDPNYDRWPSAADALRMATVNGARASCFDNQIGVIAPGRKADLVLLDTRSTYYHPQNDWINQLVHCEVGSSVTTVLVNGTMIVENGFMTMVDEQALLAEADEIGQRVAVQMRSAADFVERMEPYIRRAYLDVNRREAPINYYASDAYRRLPEW